MKFIESLVVGDIAELKDNQVRHTHTERVLITVNFSKKTNML